MSRFESFNDDYQFVEIDFDDFTPLYEEHGDIELELWMFSYGELNNEPKTPWEVTLMTPEWNGGLDRRFL